MWWLGLALAVSIDEVPDPRAEHDGRVVDMVDALPADAEARINALLKTLETDLGAEVAVVTVQSVDVGTPKDFATGLFNHWKLGDREANNGLLVLLVMDARRLEMETGYGLETVLPDSWLGNMQRQQMVPAFKAGDFGKGLEVGVQALDERMRRYPDEVRDGTRGVIEVAGDSSTRSRGNSGTSDAVVVAGSVGGGVVITGGMAFGVVAWRRKRKADRTCPDCNVYMPMLSEVDDDEHLDPGERMEEALSAIDYQVHQCPSCAHTRTFRVSRWFSGYSTCPQCSYKTRSSSQTTIQHATQYSGGLVEIREQCANCSYSSTYTRSTARLSSSSSSGSGGFSSGGSSGGGGSSWGGGSSGGGGAGSSW